MAEYRLRLEQAEAGTALVPAASIPHARNPADPEGELPPQPSTARAVAAAVRREERDRAAMLAERARRLSRAGRHTEASAPARAAVRVLGDLAEQDPAEHSPALVDALRALAAVLAGGRAYADAVKVAENAVTRARRLAALDVHRHRPLLAATLRDLGARLGDAGEAERALAVLYECVEAYRTLASRAPELHRAGLADALDEFAGRLAENGLVDDALLLFDEAARLLTLSDADVLAQVTTRQANLLARVGRVDEALERAHSAVRLRRTGTTAAAGRGDDALAAALQSFGLLLSGANRHDDAVEALEEAVALRARRVRFDPALARNPEVPVTYAVYGLVLIAADRPADAVPPLAAALGVGTALNLPQVVDMAGDALIRAHRAEPAAVRSRWRAATGENPPSWITGTRTAVAGGRIPPRAARPETPPPAAPTTPAAPEPAPAPAPAPPPSPDRPARRPIPAVQTRRPRTDAEPTHPV
ncbi:tetratricopeptide repeat protein [Yinghuangia seranimata]|uniref:tetratricopeptide repeat protein n=1 Tax=Yinghuangia seranimata TaxID=408067 RepID=UPI00248CC500|nr:tetratricopeptide repeat protein [Yinghuangia seranimata]MDI2126298.1 tetratricopeptide repeat protein [Yinghuangia seranimata]